MKLTNFWTIFIANEIRWLDLRAIALRNHPPHHDPAPQHDVNRKQACRDWRDCTDNICCHIAYISGKRIAKILKRVFVEMCASSHPLIP